MEGEEECWLVEDSMYGQDCGWVFFQHTHTCVQKSPWPFWWGSKGAIRLIESPVAHCTTLEAVPLAAAWFKAGGEITIGLAQCLGSTGVNQGHLLLRCPSVI